MTKLLLFALIVNPNFLAILKRRRGRVHIVPKILQKEERNRKNQGKEKWKVDFFTSKMYAGVAYKKTPSMSTVRLFSQVASNRSKPQSIQLQKSDIPTNIAGTSTLGRTL